MSYVLEASHIFCEIDDYMFSVGFSDDDIEPTRFVIIQQSKDYDEQDIELGMNKLHIQIEDQSRSCYGGVKEFKLLDNSLLIFLDDEAKFALQVDGDIDIKLDENAASYKKVIETIKLFCEKDRVKFS